MTSSGTSAFHDIFFASEDGLRLHARDYPARAAQESSERLPVSVKIDRCDAYTTPSSVVATW